MSQPGGVNSAGRSGKVRLAAEVVSPAGYGPLNPATLRAVIARVQRQASILVANRRSSRVPLRPDPGRGVAPPRVGRFIHQRRRGRAERADYSSAPGAAQVRVPPVVPQALADLGLPGGAGDGAVTAARAVAAGHPGAPILLASTRRRSRHQPHRRGQHCAPPGSHRLLPSTPAGAWTAPSPQRHRDVQRALRLLQAPRCPNPAGATRIGQPGQERPSVEAARTRDRQREDAPTAGRLTCASTWGGCGRCRRPRPGISASQRRAAARPAW
jgi:hypothetical protein